MKHAIKKIGSAEAEASALRKIPKLSGETSAKALFFFCAFFSVLAVFGIVLYILVESFPALREIGIVNFLFGSIWSPKHYEDPELGMEASEVFGIFPMIVSSLVVTAGAAALGGTLGVCTAVFMVHFCPERLRKGYGQLVNLLAGIPSVIYGFFGLVALVPLLESLFGVAVGKGPLAAVLVLSIMILPTVASISANSIRAVPKEYYEGALALGGNKAQTVFKICVPAARRGILSALILGIGRAVGETMAVQMVVGNTAGNYPESLFAQVATMTTHIVTEMGYTASGSLWQRALIATGFVLLCFVLLINVVLTLIRREKPGGDRRFKRKLRKRVGEQSLPEFHRTGGLQEALKYVCIAFACAVFAALGALIVFILVKGVPHLTPHFLFSAGSSTDLTIAPMLVSTLMIVAMTLVIALPLGIGAAIFLNEYAKKGSRIVKGIRLFIDTLAGIPSIVFGLFGMIFFVPLCGGSYNLLAGSLTMVLIVLPTIVRSTEESLSEIPDSMREGSYALGAGKVRTIFKIVLPSALGGLVTSVILSVGRIVGESAALIYTAGAVMEMPSGYFSSGVSFSVGMYTLMSTARAGDMEKAYATAVVLLVIVVSLNLLVALLEKKLARKRAGGGGGTSATSQTEKMKKERGKRRTEERGMAVSVQASAAPGERG